MSKAAAVQSRFAALIAGAAALVAVPSPSFGQSAGSVQPASAPSDYYFRVAGGVSAMSPFPHDQVGANLSLAFGKHAFFSTLRGEVEVSFAQASSHKCSPDDWERACYGGQGPEKRVRVTSVMATAYFDFREGQALRPFIGAGLRYEGQGTTTEIGETLSSVSGTGVNLTAGLSYAVRPQWVVQLAYQGLVEGPGRDDRAQLGFRYRR